MQKKHSPFHINIESLRDGSEMELEELLPPAFFEIKEGDEIVVRKDFSCTGRVYLADTYIIVEMLVDGEVELPCAFCNEIFPYSIHMDVWRHEEPISSIKHGVFDYGMPLRESILLEIPFYPLCGGKECKNRKNIEHYLKKTSCDEENKSEYHPFSDLQI